jgi:NAD(P)-dependent dehydrogenase (short-subunit alcohol dehydrogenase family)
VSTDEGALTGRVALITGASRGIGLAIAERFARAGATVAVTARTVQAGESRFEGSLTETVASVVDAGGTAIAIPADLTDPDARVHIVDETTRRLGPIDVLVNNAAVTWFGPVETFDMRRYDLMFDVQVKTPFELAQLVLPAMRERGHGWILNISSGAARHPQGPPYTPLGRGGAVYGMCKAALERFTTGLAAEVYESGVAVNALSPAGIVPTPGVVHHQLIRPGMESFVEQPEVIAEAALALCTADPASLNGRIAYSRPLLDELGIVPPS